VLREPSGAAAWDACLAALDAHFRRRRAIYVQSWPPVVRDDDRGLEAFIRAGYEEQLLFRSHVFTSTRLAVDLVDRSEEQRLASFRSETRQHYRRAMKRGLEVRVGRTHEDLRRSYELLEMAGRERGLRPRPYESLVLAFDRLIDKRCGLLLQAWKGSDLVGTLLLLFAGRTATCFTSAMHRSFSWYYPMEFMHVSAMRLAQEHGMHVYDLMNWTTSSVAHFKSGFRPTTTSWAPPRTKVYRPALARIVAWSERRLRPVLRRAIRWRASRAGPAVAVDDAGSGGC
jgi:lipid II:glycine glycyltransferase (peptidoglycan interpeptide bridge formation enzyme)